MTSGIVPLKRLATIKARVGWKGLTSDEFETKSYAYLVTGRDFKAKLIDWKTCYQVSRERFDDDPFIQLVDGDLLITKDGTIGKVALVQGLDKPACLNSGVFVVRPHSGLEPGYLYWVLQSRVFADFVDEVSRGSTIQHLYQEEFREMRLPIPDRAEQQRIADFLDRETARIDAFIAKNEELITLLTERRAAVIADAVTRGLDPSVTLKDSGVESLGRIPSAWSVRRVRDVGRAIIGLTYAPDEICGPDEGGTLVLRAGNVQDGRLDYSDTVYVTTRIPRNLRLVVGDIVICARNGSARLVGKNAVADDQVAGETWGAFMTVLRTPINGYLRWVLNSTIFTTSIGSFSTATINQLTSSTLHALQFAMPPAAERDEISAYLEGATARIDNAIGSAHRGVDLARERRAALISAAVIGKIDVGVAV